MPISLTPLPYGTDALAPAISAETLEVHHGKHHKAYVDKTNAAIAGTPRDQAPLEQIIGEARGGDHKLFNNAAQSWNHAFYWASLSPDGGTPREDPDPSRIETIFISGHPKPEAEPVDLAPGVPVTFRAARDALIRTDLAIGKAALLERIERDFGSLDALTGQLARQGADHFASGWVWLADEAGTLKVVETHDADTLADQSPRPLLVIDLWEHAYYLDHKNVRPDYLKAVLGEVLNWDFAARNLSRGDRWTYAGACSAA